MLRRSRGYVPEALRAAGRRAAPLLACGAELKSTFCVAKGGARLGRPPHRRPRATPRRCAPSARASRTSSGSSPSTPEVVAHDLHPDYLSTTYALEREGVALVGVQHHHAHLAAVPGRARRARARGRGDLRRHRATAPTARSGAARCSSATCAASSAPATCGRCGCPAATARSREPWRMACAWLVADGGRSRRCRARCAAGRRRALARGRASWRAPGSPRR